MKFRLLIIDNYDSFTYNLVQLVEKCGIKDYIVTKNDKVNINNLNTFDKIIFSPGPGIPNVSGIMYKIIDTYGHLKSILGICLGHQAIAEFYGAKLIQSENIFHGSGLKTIITKKSEYIFKGITNDFITGRYHSWIVSSNNFPNNKLEIIAVDDTNTIMAIKHKKFDIIGLQFHPESYITEYGHRIMKNWLNKK